MSIVGTVKHQPNDVQDYDIDYSEWFPVDDVITEAVIGCTPPMVMLPSYAIGPANVVKVWVYAGGVDGITHKITVRAITSDGREKEAELRVKIKEV